jgi:hypothetical protein
MKFPIWVGNYQDKTFTSGKGKEVFEHLIYQCNGNYHHILLRGLVSLSLSLTWQIARMLFYLPLKRRKTYDKTVLTLEFIFIYFLFFLVLVEITFFFLFNKICLKDEVFGSSWDWTDA